MTLYNLFGPIETISSSIARFMKGYQIKTSTLKAQKLRKDGIGILENFIENTLSNYILTLYLFTVVLCFVLVYCTCSVSHKLCSVPVHPQCIHLKYCLKQSLIIIQNALFNSHQNNFICLLRITGLTSFVTLQSLFLLDCVAHLNQFNIIKVILGYPLTV